MLTGRKTANERFPGAINTLACEAMMRDGKALQMGTSHELGQNFAKVFGTQFSSETGSQEYVWQTSWGVSTRMMGGLIMAHGDDSGLRLPPRLAPTQVVVVLVRGEDGAGEVAERLASELRAAGVRAQLDAATDAELRAAGDRLGAPRGARAHRGGASRPRPGHRDGGPARRRVEVGGSPSRRWSRACPACSRPSRTTCWRPRRRPVTAATADAATVDEAGEAAATGFARVPWRTLMAGDGEARLRELGVTVRVLQRPDGTLPASEDEPDTLAVVARSY